MSWREGRERQIGSIRKKTSRQGVITNEQSNRTTTASFVSQAYSTVSFPEATKGDLSPSEHLRLLIPQGRAIWRSILTATAGVALAASILVPYRGAAAEPGQNLIYVVQSGDTLYGISLKFDVDDSLIAQANSLSNEDFLSIGQELAIPQDRSASQQPTSRSGRTAELSVGAVTQPEKRETRATSYTVAAGDTLLGIASKVGSSAEDLMRLNNLTSGGNLLFPGQQLNLPAPPEVHYTVAAGDTLYGIASKQGVDLDDIVAANHLQPPYLLSIGKDLLIPGGPVSAATTTAKPATALAAQPQPQAEPAQPAQPQAEAVQGQPDADEKGQELAGIAKQYLGYAYRWGGVSPATGFDCSGFVWFVYRQAGLNVASHDLWGQLAAGPRVDRGDLLPGDIVFFQNTYTAGLSHSGIYVGGGKFVSAQSESTGVTMVDLSQSYWANRYYGASRGWR